MKTSLELAKSLLAFAILFQPLTTFANASRVENGTTVAADDALNQSVVLMYFNSSLCSASFLTQTVLVTAGHCTSAASTNNTEIHVRDSAGKWWSSKVTKISTHPDYLMQQTATQGTFVKNDVGVVELAGPFPFAVRPMKIGSVDYLRPSESNVTVAGYGMNSTSGGSGTLRTGTMRAQVVPVVNFFDRDGILMVPLSNNVVCPGDSGGAVIKGSASSTTLLAVNSISNGCKHAGNKAWSSSEFLSQHKTWIKKVAPSVP